MKLILKSLHGSKIKIISCLKGLADSLALNKFLKCPLYKTIMISEELTLVVHCLYIMNITCISL